MVTAAAIFVLFVPLPMWWSRHEDAQDRKGRDTRTVVVTRVVEQGNDDLVSARIEDRLISFSYPGKVSAGDEVEVYRADSQWHAMEQSPLWLPIAATALCWGFAGFALVFYPRMARRRGWTRAKGST
ncbi:hypothetical protein BH10ACT1_BH10ACT1_36620 [soil metagenome]